MCGIVGSFNPFGDACSSAVLQAMRDRMVHRGPDGAGLWRSADGHCALGHRRLSIIDLSVGAQQPMSNPQNTVTVVFNGEIYNHAELRQELVALGKYQWVTDHSDTEVLLNAYQEWGLSCIDRFAGMFAFAIYDSRDRSRPVLHLVRDRVGKKPMYFAQTKSGEWLFASEIRALFAHPDLSPEMDRTAFWHYLTFIVTPAPLTLFRGIFKLPAGHRMTINNSGSAAAQQWWDCRPDASQTLTTNDLSEDDAVAEVTRLLRQSIKRRMVSDVPFGVLLSGGVDSSLNVALMSELMDRPVNTFTIGYEGQADTNEYRFARRISDRYKTNHHESTINHRNAQEFLPLLVRLQDEPIADNVCIPLYFLADLVKKSGTTVVQVGEGADENFLGYWWCEHYRKKYEQVYRPAFNDSLGLMKSALGALSAEDSEIIDRARVGKELFWGGAACWWGKLRHGLTPNSAIFKQAIDCPVSGLMPAGFDATDSHAVVGHYLGSLSGKLVSPEILQKISYMEMKLRLPEHLLMRVDKLTMAHSVEARAPFLDHDLVDFATRLPLEYKLRGGVGKWLLKKAAEPYLDHDMIYRTKQGFGAPMDQWFKDPEFGARCLNAFRRSELTREGFFDTGFFESMLLETMAGRGGYSFQVWTVLNAVMWHASWIEGREDCL